MTFQDHATAATDAVFASLARHATAERFLSGPPDVFATPSPVTALPTTTDRLMEAGGTTLILAEASFEVRVAEWAAPAEKDRITIYPTLEAREAATGGIRYRIAMAPRRPDKRGLKWLLGCRKERNQ